MFLGFRRHLVIGRGRLFCPGQRIVREKQQRRRRHGKRHRQRQQPGEIPADHPVRKPRREQHEGELAALAEHDAEPPRGGIANAPPASEPVEHGELHRDQPGRDRDQRSGLRHENREIDRHAHGHEEHGEQQPFEGRDIRFDLVAVFGVGQQGAGDERAERRREPDLFHEERHAHHRHQRARGHGLAHAHGRDQTIETAEQKTAPDDDGGNGEDGDPRRWRDPSPLPHRPAQRAAPKRSKESRRGPETAAPKRRAARGAWSTRPFLPALAGQRPWTTAIKRAR